MRVLHVLNKQMPPTGKDGGLPVMVDTLARAQKEMGYDVGVMVVLKSEKKPLNKAKAPYNIYEVKEDNLKAGISDVVKKNDYSLLHLHNDYKEIKKFARLTNIGYVRTEHSIVSEELRTVEFFENVVFVSKSHAREHNRSEYVYNGIDIKSFKYNESKKDYLLFLGKVARRKKGAADAVRVAKYLREPLMVVGGRNNRLPSTWLRWPGSVVYPAGVLWGNKKLHVLADAKCLLVPSRWEEPFGLIMIEALASGTPVIAYSRGAAAEIIKQGETGYLCDNWQEMAERVADIPRLRSKDCLKDVKLRFSAASMAKGYTTYYERVLAGDCW